MPTPLTAARQTLTDEAARALDDAVAVARRRCHTQTTSLHAMSALLATPSSTLRDACARASGGNFSSPPHLQLRVLELSVGVSLDRIPSSRSSPAVDEPPVSNSLMAAIKRSQGNQRRSPKSFHFLNQAQGTPSFPKVELKHFVLSILDDPIVNRVFTEAGFRSCDVKLALLQPPVARTRPVFLCNLKPGRAGPGFSLDENSSRIVEILARKSKRNPLLVGVYAKGAMKNFTELVQKGRGGESLFPTGVAGLSVVSVGNEVAEFVTRGESEEKMGVRFQELSREVEQCAGSGVVVSFGEVEVLVGESVNAGAVGFVVEELTRLLEVHGGKVWLVGVAETSGAYSKFLGLFPNVENDLDLHLLTVTSATSSMEGLYSKSSLMGSFVPFGGFFPTPSEIKSHVSSTNASFARCDECNGKYELEVANTLNVNPAALTSSYSTSLPWLHKGVRVDTCGRLNVAKTNEENTSLNDKVLGFQKKWSDICQRLHHARSLPEFDISRTMSPTPSLEFLRFGSGFKDSSSRDLTLVELQCSDTVNVDVRTGCVSKVSNSIQIDTQTPRVTPLPMTNMSALAHISSSSLIPVTTDLGLGTLYTSTSSTVQERDTPKLQNQIKHLQHLSESISPECDAINGNTSHQLTRSSCSGSNLEGIFDKVDFKSLNQLLTEKVGWQDQAIRAISQTLFLCKSGAGKCRSSHGRADIWFSFHGPDRIGKRKIASALAEAVFGNTVSLISVDLGFQDRFYPLNSMFESQKSSCYGVLRRKTVVDYIAGELRKKPYSVVFLENVDKADFLVQTSLLQAIRTGKFPDSHGRVVSINNTIFLVTSTICKGKGSFVSEESKMFSEDRILETKACQMQLLLGDTSEDSKGSSSTNVKVVPREKISKPSFLNKRKQVDSSDSIVGTTCKMQKQVSETSRTHLDLNMPLEEGEEGINDSVSDYENESRAENADAAWLSDFCNQVDEKVDFKPFNFDVLAEQMLKSISIQFQRTFGSEFQLEIDYEVMAQILAAAWLAEKKNAAEDWVEYVLGKCFVEAKQKTHPAAQSVFKLVSCESIFVEEQAPGVCLTARVNLN
ncbi:protein SMAX1-LIKE 6-like [Lotus japonicus]|uniref:protein SMAX1-LIKE 6-like n=1 Tax=Lotus japonicus TaxID=34305 RepID=UPI00258CFE4F|nr:protein SMAX1-LIKE 6-like [Lotus japonicus]